MDLEIAVLGSTGSIGRQTLDVAGKLGIRVKTLTANKSVELIEQQARAFLPDTVVMEDKEAARQLESRLFGTGIRVLQGEEAGLDAARSASTVVCAVSGIAALGGVLAAASGKRRVALANKEALVCAGTLIKRTAKENGAQIIPVDSEHSAIFQCLQGNTDRGEVAKLILTASGGPFFGKNQTELERVTVKDALAHPNWSMGQKITIDSATMMNKGLEVIEAMRLYDMPSEKIEVVVHRQSIIHSLVEYRDGAQIAQLGQPDMRLPIQYALTYPARLPCPANKLDLAHCGPLTFAPPDLAGFPCLRIAMETSGRGEIACTAMNSANEEAVEAFIRQDIGFLDIARVIEQVLADFDCHGSLTLENIEEADRRARQAARQIILCHAAKRKGMIK